MGAYESVDSREYLIKKAEELKPALRYSLIKPTSGIPSGGLGEGERVVIDFGNHYVGRFGFSVETIGSHQDAPLFLHIKLCESRREIDERSEDYHGWISRSWVQEEWLHIDVAPQEITLPRRYAVRYAVIEVAGCSSKFEVVISDAWLTEETSADDASIEPFFGEDEEKRLDEISIRTLRGCMQEIFEDGPKRDRRLWLGDLRLQALTDSVTFRNAALVRRCLYLFAGCADDKGRVPACLFTEPEIEGDDTYMFDYSLFFIAALYDYVSEYDDTDTARELFGTAVRQWELARDGYFDGEMVCDSDELGWCFLDWNLDLNKQAGAQFVYIYCVKRLKRLAEILGENELCGELDRDIEAKSAAAMRGLWDSRQGVFVSGSQRQVSYAANSWAVIAEVVSPAEAGDILTGLSNCEAALPMVTPYMNHVYIEALLYAGMKNEAYEQLMSYWGGMVRDGADTFYELFDPDDPDASPYGSPIVNSYCHAWSCTPSYLMRRCGLTKARISGGHGLKWSGI